MAGVEAGWFCELGHLVSEGTQLELKRRGPSAVPLYFMFFFYSVQCFWQVETLLIPDTTLSHVSLSAS